MCFHLLEDFVSIMYDFSILITNKRQFYETSRIYKNNEISYGRITQN